MTQNPSFQAISTGKSTWNHSLHDLLHLQNTLATFPVLFSPGDVFVLILLIISQHFRNIFFFSLVILILLLFNLWYLFFYFFYLLSEGAEPHIRLYILVHKPRAPVPVPISKNRPMHLRGRTPSARSP